MEQQNSDRTLTITGLDSRGRGVARDGGKVIFVPFALPGEQVAARITRQAARYDEAALIQVLSPSSSRVPPPCPYFGLCGGCALQHMDYTAQLEHKRQMVLGAMARIAGLRDAAVEPTLGMADPWRYRNKAAFALDRQDGHWVWGYRAEGSHRLVPIEDCLLVPSRAAALAWAACLALNKTDAVASGLTVRTATSGETLVILEGPDITAPAPLADALTQAGADSVLYRGPGGLQVLQGRDFLEDELAGLRIRVAADAFLQVNPRQTAVLYDQVARRAALSGRETVVDLYCGTGTIGLTLAARAGRVVGVEIQAAAVENAAENARMNGISNARFLCGDAQKAFARLAAEGLTPDLVIVDPPRRGCDDALPAAIAATRCPRVLYVSCDPATLARDLARFMALGYTPSPITPVDMFPQTEHVETVVLMSRVEK